MLCGKTFELDEKTIIGGDYKEYYWKIKDNERNIYMDCEDLKMNFSLIEYNDRYGTYILSKECSVSKIDENTNEFKLTLLKSETQSLVGKYIYQLTIETPNHKQESLQGILNVRKNINPNVYPTEEGLGE